MNGSIIEIINKLGVSFCNHALGMLLQSSILIAALLVIDLLLRKRIKAVFRYCIWLLVFVKLIIPPTLSLPTGVGYWLGDLLPTKSASIETTETSPIDNFAGPLLPYTRSTEPFINIPVSEIPAVKTNVIEAVTPAINTQGIIFLAWIVGELILVSLFLQRMFFVRRIIAQSRPAESRLQEILGDSCQRLVIRKKIELRISQNLHSPAACGLLKHKIILPVSLLQHFSSEKLRTTILHELAHIKRKDIWINSLQTALQIFYFYNPLLWVANIIVRRIREQAVDETVLVYLGQKADTYSSTLVDIAEIAFAKPSLGLNMIGVVESKKALVARIRHITSRPFPTSVRLGVFRTIAIIVAACIFLPMARATEKPASPNTNITASELLNKCTETLDKTYTSFITQSKVHRYLDYKTDIEGLDDDERDTYYLQEFRTDGKRFKTIQQKYGVFSDGAFHSQSEKDYLTHVYDGSTIYDHFRPNNSPGRVSVHTKVKDEEKNISLRLSFESPISHCFGYLIRDVERFDRIIKKDGIGQMSVREEKYKGITHYVIEAKTTRGQYQIWLNPEKGYNFSKATVTRKAGDLFAYSNKVVKAGEDMNFTIENEEFKQVDDLWVPVKAKTQIYETLQNNGYKKINQELELTSILINPGHNALNSFSTDDIKNGAMVMIDGKQPIYTWKNGKVIDSFGYEINLSTSKSPSLVGKTLPSVAEFGVALDPNVFKSKKLLVCFFDCQQQSSQNSILTLNKQAQSLLNKDIYLVFIQAESVTEQALAAWLTQNKIQPPVGASKIDLSALGLRWGVKSLPWLILTDKNHKVTAEGFVIGELDKKITETDR